MTSFIFRLISSCAEDFIRTKTATTWEDGWVHNHIVLRVWQQYNRQRRHRQPPNRTTLNKSHRLLAGETGWKVSEGEGNAIPLTLRVGAVVLDNVGCSGSRALAQHSELSAGRGPNDWRPFRLIVSFYLWCWFSFSNANRLDVAHFAPTMN